MANWYHFELEPQAYRTGYSKLSIDGRPWSSLSLDIQSCDSDRGDKEIRVLNLDCPYENIQNIYCYELNFSLFAKCTQEAETRRHL